MENKNPEQTPVQIKIEPEKGSLFRTQYTSRPVTGYLVHESELKHISFLNALALIMFTIGGGVASFAINQNVTIFVSDSMAGSAREIMKLLIGLSYFACVVFFGIGIWAILSKGSEIDRIKRESKTSNLS